MKTLRVVGPADIKVYKTVTKADGTSGAEQVDQFDVKDGLEILLLTSCMHNDGDHLLIDGEEGYIYDENGFEKI